MRPSVPPWLGAALVGALFGLWFSSEQLRLVTPQLSPLYPASMRAVTVVQVASIVTLAFFALVGAIEWLGQARLGRRWELAFALATTPLLVSVGGASIATAVTATLVAAGLVTVAWARRHLGREDLARHREVFLVLLGLVVLGYVANDGVSPRLSEHALTQGSLNLRNVNVGTAYRGFVWTKQLALSDDDYSMWGALRRSTTSIQSIPLLLAALARDVPSLDVAGFMRLLHGVLFWHLTLGSFGLYLYLRFGLRCGLPASAVAGALFVFGNGALRMVHQNDGPVFISPFVVLPFGLLLFRNACRSGRPALALASGAIMASQFYVLAPHPEGALISVLAYAAIALPDAVVGEVGDRPRRYRLGLLVLVGVAFTLIAAADVVPVAWQLRAGALDIPGHAWAYPPTHVIDYSFQFGDPRFHRTVAFCLVLATVELCRQVHTGRCVPAYWGCLFLALVALSVEVEGMVTRLDRALGAVGLHLNLRQARMGIALVVALLVLAGRGGDALGPASWTRGEEPRGRASALVVRAAPFAAAVLVALAFSLGLLALLREHVLWRTPRQQLSQTLGVLFVTACGLAALPFLVRGVRALAGAAPRLLPWAERGRSRLGRGWDALAFLATAGLLLWVFTWSRFESHHADDNPNELPYYVTLAANVANTPGLAGDRANARFLRERLERFERDASRRDDALARAALSRYRALRGDRTASSLADGEVLAAAASVADVVDDFNLRSGVHPHVGREYPLPKQAMKYGLDGLFTAVPGRAWRVCGATDDHRWLGLGPGLLLHDACTDLDTRVYLGYPLVQALYVLARPGRHLVLTEEVFPWVVPPAVLADASCRKRLAIGGIDAYVVPRDALPRWPDELEPLPSALHPLIDDGLVLLRDRRSYGVTYLARSATSFDAALASRAENQVRLRARQRIGDAELDAALAPLTDALLALREKHDVVVEGAAPALGSGDPGTAKVVGFVGPRIVIEATGERDEGLLVLNLAALPGWRAYVGDRPAPIRRVNFGFMGVPVPRGKHLVWFVYAPWPDELASLVSLLSAVALALAWRRRPVA